MMKVILEANWSVDGYRFRQGRPKSQWVEIPDHFRDRLPTTAKVVDDDTPDVAKAEVDLTAAMKRAAHRYDGVSTPGQDGPVSLGELARQQETDFTITPEPEPEPEPEGDPRDIPGCSRVGSWYNLPDGTQVNGKANAEAALAAHTQAGE